MTAEEFFNLNTSGHMWVRASDMGIDQDGGVWVRSDAELRKELPLIGFKSWVMLFSDRMSGLPGKDQNSSAWKKVVHLGDGPHMGWTEAK